MLFFYCCSNENNSFFQFLKHCFTVYNVNTRMQNIPSLPYLILMNFFNSGCKVALWNWTAVNNVNFSPRCLLCIPLFKKAHQIWTIKISTTLSNKALILCLLSQQTNSFFFHVNIRTAWKHIYFQTRKIK